MKEDRSAAARLDKLACIRLILRRLHKPSDRTQPYAARRSFPGCFGVGASGVISCIA